MKITKIAITGHTEGIGKAISDRFRLNYQVVGFSRSNGYDISKHEDLERIVADSMDCEVFINNAYYFDQQLVLADLWDSAHSGKEDFIINISSLAADPIFEIEKRMPYLVPYAEEKHRLNKKTFDICNNLGGKRKAISVLLGIVDTKFINPYGSDPENMLEHYESFRKNGTLIQPEDVAEAIEHVIGLAKSNCFVYSISILNRF